MNILLDSNIIIYATKPEYEFLRKHLKEVSTEYSISVITMIEVLGYYLLTEQNKKELELFFLNTASIPIDDFVVKRAIKLRQGLKMSLGDSIIAATALLNNLELWTNNLIDFEGIPELKLFNPLKKGK
jgi:toxin FitB